PDTSLFGASPDTDIEMAIALKKAQDCIGQLMSERSQIDKKFHEMKSDLITRLQNACSQRDEARGRVRELETEMSKTAESLQSKDREVPTAAAAAASAAAAAQAVQNCRWPRRRRRAARTAPGAPGTAATAMQSMLQASAPGGQVERGQEDNSCLAYWLSNTVTLLHMLNKNIKPASGNLNKARVSAVATDEGAATRSGLGAMFGSHSGASPSGLAHDEVSIQRGGMGGFKQVEAKYPAQLFKKQLDAFAQKIFPMIRDNQVGMRDGKIHGVAQRGQAVQPVERGEAAARHPQHLQQPEARAHVAERLQRAAVQVELVQVGQRTAQVGDAAAHGRVDDQLQRDRVLEPLDARKLLEKSLEEITSDLCPVLSIQQLYRISTMYWDDRYNTETDLYSGVPVPEVLQEGEGAASFAFLEKELRFAAPPPAPQ
ncbi:hypothetical protein TSOC_012467, partial [Tetrabaena socialis]